MLASGRRSWKSPGTAQHSVLAHQLCSPGAGGQRGGAREAGGTHRLPRALCQLQVALALSRSPAVRMNFAPSRGPQQDSRGGGGGPGAVPSPQGSHFPASRPWLGVLPLPHLHVGTGGSFLPPQMLFCFQMGCDGWEEWILMNKPGLLK